MLSANAFEQWCQRLAFPEETTKTIIRIRSSPPSRLVRSAAGNVSGRYTSKKMGCSIQYESYKNELPFLYHLEREASVLEFYDQPEKIELVYQNKDDTRRVVVKHTPDFFVLQEEAAGWVECKMEEDLVRLAKQIPHRYVHNMDGTWSCPPGEAYAKPMGLFYQIRSSREIDWIVYRNCRFLQQYRRGPRVSVSSDTVAAIRDIVMRHPGIALFDLLQTLKTETADDVYFLIVTDQLYVDLAHTLLEEPEKVQVFPDQKVAETHTTMNSSSFSYPGPAMLSISVGTPLWWDGKPWTVFNPGLTAITLLSEDHQLKEIPNQDFDILLREGKMTGLASQTEEAGSGAARMLLDKASPKHLEVALERYRALGNQAERSVPPRTLRRWRASYHEAEVLYGNGFVVLTTVYNCAQTKLTTPRYGGSLWEMLLSIPTGDGHDQEQDSEYHTRISKPRQVHSRHRDHIGHSQEHGAQIPAPPRTGRHAPSASQSSFQAGSVQGTSQEVDRGRSLLQL